MAWQDQAAAVLGADGETVARVAGRPSDLAALAAYATEAARQAGVEVLIASSSALGMHTVRLRGGSPEGQAQAFIGMRDHALSQGAGVLLRQRPRAVDALVDALGPPPSSVGLLKQIKAQFDPTGRLAPGRFRPWY